MKKTVILSPYKNNFSGMANLCEGRVRFTVNHPTFSPGRHLKLYALSTSRAAMSPEAVGIISPTGRSTVFETDIASGTGALNGAAPDTYLITLVTDDVEEPVLAAFFGLEWNAARVLDGKKEKEAEKEGKDEKDEKLTGMTSEDKTLSYAAGVLEAFKKGAGADDKKIKSYVDELRNNLKSCEKFNSPPSESFEWYKVRAGHRVSSLTAIEHILSGGSARENIKAAGYYLAAIKKSDSRHLAIGIPGCRNLCPMPQLSDCCDYSGGFHIAGVFLDKDGQYFEKYLQNDK